MGSRPHAAHPGFLERLAFLIERFARLQQVGSTTTTYGLESGSPLSLRPMNETELAESTAIGLSSAVWHLQYGETHSRWSQDSYLERLQKATPEQRQKALAEHGWTEADYDHWVKHYGIPPTAH